LALRKFTPRRASAAGLALGRAHDEPVDPTIKGRLADLGYTVYASAPAHFGKLIANETEKWGSVIRTADIKPE
jgi:hypothetical protein